MITDYTDSVKIQKVIIEIDRAHVEVKLKKVFGIFVKKRVQGQISNLIRY